MATYNKELEDLTYNQIILASERFLMGWHDPKYDGHNFRIKGLNRRRSEYGLEPLTKDMSVAYRVNYIKMHYTDDEIKAAITDYISKNLLDDARWTGIELLDCRFGRDYAKIFKILLGNSTWHKLSESCRVKKLITTQNTLYGGVGVKNKAAYDKMISTKSQLISDKIDLFRDTGNLDLSVFASDAEKIVFQYLVAKFGKQDVYYQYGIHPYDARYPYPCDFYIKSLDLFIELNVHYSHGNHWYDESNPDDKLRVKNLLETNNVKNVKSVKTWCDIDIKKRNAARLSGIKYLVFWDGKYLHHNENGSQGYIPRLLDFRSWYFDYDCNYDKFIHDYPINTY